MTLNSRMVAVVTAITQCSGQSFEEEECEILSHAKVQLLGRG